MQSNNTELKQLFSKLISNTPTRSKGIYLSDGLYLMENGDILEEHFL